MTWKLQWPLRKVADQPTTTLTPEKQKEALQFRRELLDQLNAMPTNLTGVRGKGLVTEFKAPELPPGVCPSHHRMVMDQLFQPTFDYANIAFDGQGFVGYPFLSQLTQFSEYRSMTETVAGDMVRKWVKLKSESNDKIGDKIKELEDHAEKFHVREHFQEQAELDGFYGRGQLFVDLGDVETEELQTPMLLNKYKIPKGSLKGFKKIEPITTYPYRYNSTNPLARDYYEPRSWFVMGKQVHASRLIPFISRKLPDILKPAYNFSGLSMSQMAIPYVDNWLQTRQGVNRLINSYSTSGIKTDLAALLKPNSAQAPNLIQRMEAFTLARNNQGLMMLDKNTEEFFQFNATLAELSKLQAQAQEHMAAVAHTPLVILLGITPSGLNVSTEGEIRVYYDYVKRQQEKLFRRNLQLVYKILMLDLWGEIIPDITFDFVELFELTGTELAKIRKSDSDAAVELIAAGVISPDEERSRIAKDPNSGYSDLQVDAEIPEPNPDLTAAKDPIIAKANGTKPAEAF